MWNAVKNCGEFCDCIDVDFSTKEISWSLSRTDQVKKAVTGNRQSADSCVRELNDWTLDCGVEKQRLGLRADFQNFHRLVSKPGGMRRAGVMDPPLRWPFDTTESRARLWDSSFFGWVCRRGDPFRGTDPPLRWPFVESQAFYSQTDPLLVRFADVTIVLDLWTSHHDDYLQRLELDVRTAPLPVWFARMKILQEYVEVAVPLISIFTVHMHRKNPNYRFSE